jgi:hypothetical protein
LKEVSYNWTTQSQDWESWNRFLIDNPRGIYLQTKEWLESYLPYGFSPFLLIARDSEGNILGGIGAVLAKVGPFKVLIAPYGPILNCGLENLAIPLIESFKNLAQSKGAFLAQVSFPSEATEENFHSAHLLSSKLSDQTLGHLNKGLLFKFVIGISAFRAVNLYAGQPDAYEKVRSNYKSATRRDVNKSGRIGNELFFAKSETEIKIAYDLILINAENQGYAVRSWQEFGYTLVSMVKEDLCFIPCCKNEGELKGALVIFDVGKKLHYIMGGIIREKKDLMVGHFLQDQVIQIGIQKGYEFYDISMGGSKGVVRFKEGFGGEIIGLVEPQYWVLKPLQFMAFQKLLPWVQKNKKLFSQILSKLQ